MILAAGAGNALVVKALLAGGASPNQADASGTTALMHAVMPRRLAVARVLVDAGANLDVQDAMGRTALHVAASTGTGEGVRLLLRHGADVLATDAQGRNALQVAQESELSRQRFHMPPDPTRRDILNLLRKAGLKE